MFKNMELKQTKPSLLVSYHVIPEHYQFVIEPDDDLYEFWEQCDGLLINSNDEDYPEELSEKLGGIEIDSKHEVKFKKTPPKLIEGEFKIIQCGFML